MITTNENSTVRIAVRERPAKDHLKSNSYSSVINYHPNGNNIIVNEAVFTFDYVLGPMVTQEEIYDKLIKPLVINLKLGYNCTALAYGQTGTGKSYTMGLNSKSFDEDDVGIIPRCLEELFSIIENQENYDNVITLPKLEISVSFIEIYNEKAYDLLGENTNEPIAARGYKYTGGTRKPLTSIQDCYAILMQGNKNRHVRPTKMNSQSSRSHAIFKIHVLTRTQKANGEEVITTSCMNMVDLAGSEGVRRTGHQGVAMSEGVHINQGLLSIGKVLQAMTTGSKVIPYRDSVLSSVLQESLNSNSYLTLLACVSPHREDLSETLSTLRFAQNAKQLKSAPEINTVIAEIKKNIKLKQTPYKVRPMQIVNNNRVTPQKRPYSTLYGTQAKMIKKSSTFCTPKKQTVEANKFNQTEISSNAYRKKLSNDAINLPKINQLELIRNRESLFNRSSDSNGSLVSLNNMSTSTAINGAANNRSSNFSPIIRKYIGKLKKDLEDNLSKIMQTNYVHQTPAPVATPKNQTRLPSTIREEIKSIMKEVLYEENAKTNDEDVKKNTRTKCQLFNSCDEVFKIPDVPSEPNMPKTSSPIMKNIYSVTTPESFSLTFFSGASNLDKTVLNKSIRRSCRLLQKQRLEQSTSINDSVLANSNHSLRRSTRQSVLQMYQNKRRSIRLAARTESPQIQEREERVKESNAVKKSNKATKLNSINNTIIDGYCNGSASTINKTSLAKHRKAVLDLLNTGSMKELQILPQIGQKTAYLIVTQRTLSGKFKKWSQVEKLPIWRGNAWERFAQANMLI